MLAHHRLTIRSIRERERALDQADDDAGSDRIMVPTEREREHTVVNQTESVRVKLKTDNRERTSKKKKKESAHHC